MIRHFRLPPEAVQRAIDAGGPLQDLQVDPAKLAEMSVAVVEVDGQIVAYWVVWYALHAEPLWVHPDHRHSAGVAGGLVEELQAILEGSGEPVAYAEIATENLALVAPMAERLGFHEAPGKLFYLVLQPVTVPGGD